jgi:hypothetical protein
MADLRDAPPIAPVSRLVVTTANLEPRIYYLAPNYRIIELAWYEARWHWRDITPVNNPQATPDFRRLAATSIDGKPRVYYTHNEEIQELAWNGNEWVWTAIGVLSGADRITGRALEATSSHGQPLIYYGANGERIPGTASRWYHVNLLTRYNGTWHHYNVTAPHRVPGSWQVDDSFKLLLTSTMTGNTRLAASLLAGTRHGQLHLYPDGSFTYAPAPGFTGPDSFTYVAQDGTVSSLLVTVELFVTDECAWVDGNVIDNDCFERGRRRWQLQSEGAASLAVSSDNPFAGRYSAQVLIATPSVNDQLYQRGIALQPNTTYQLSFAARSSDGRNLSVWLHQHTHPYTNYGLRSQEFDLKSYWRYFTVVFHTPNLPQMSDARLRFWFTPYDQAGTVYVIDRVLLRALP